MTGARARRFLGDVVRAVQDVHADHRARRGGLSGARGLVKIDIDKNQTIAAQLRVQSVPTVYAFLQGQPVDAFAGAVGERELKAFIDRLLAARARGAGRGGGYWAAGGGRAGGARRGGGGRGARDVPRARVEAPERADVGAGLARALTLGGRCRGRARVLDALPEAAKKDAVGGAGARGGDAGAERGRRGRSGGGAARDGRGTRGSRSDSSPTPMRRSRRASATRRRTRCSA